VEKGKHLKRFPAPPADSGRDAPYPAASRAKLSNFLSGELQNAVRRVRANRMQRNWLLLAEPLKAVRVVNLVYRSSFGFFNFTRNGSKSGVRRGRRIPFLP